MAYFFECDSYKNHLIQEDAGVRNFVQRQIDNLKCRSTITPSKKLKKYDKSAGIYIMKLQGVGHNMRVIIQEFKDIDIPEPIFFLRDYISQSEYEPRWRTRIEPKLNEQGEYLRQYPLEIAELSAAKIAYEDSKNKQKKVLKKLIPELTDWLQEFGVDQDFAIYETRYWVEFAEKEIGGFESQFCNLLSTLYQGDGNEVDLDWIQRPNRSIVVLHDQSIFVVVEDTKLTLRDKIPVYILLGGGFLNKTGYSYPGIDSICDDPTLSQVNDKRYDFEIISRASYRAYPASLLKEPKRWIEMEKGSPKANLALSPEQVDLLKQYRFPKFINGQAGSGKSEMLYYLFAEICFRKHAVGFEGNPIFLTENEELLERALYDTDDKIKNNAAYSGFSTSDDLQRYFMPFQKFILQNLIEDPENYLPEKWVNFTRFKTLYESSNLPKATIRRLPAEVAWFVIYSFIKGYAVDRDEFTLEDFARLPKKDQQVIDHDTYKQVFEQVWEPFYKLKRNEGYWDRLDLVRWVLQNYEEFPEEQKYTVILCDEAQDFTRIELQLLLKLSKYLDYDISDLQQLPLTFAGDPFQTVNPTGFSLEKLKRLFGEEVEKSMQTNLPPDFIQELQYNYRSGAPIVNLANIIQYMRYRFFEMTDLRLPQQAMRVGDYDLTETFTFEEFDQTLQEKLKYAAFILPCNDGEEEQILQDNHWLIKKDLNVKSAAQAKGSEYPVVVLYGFGAEFTHQFKSGLLQELMSVPHSFSELKPGEKFKLLFFFNKLYVAVTRAQEKLYLVDSFEGFEALWSFFQSDYLDTSEVPGWDGIRPELAFQKGDPLIVEQIDPATARKNAEADRETANLFNDPIRMRQAAKWFKMLGLSYKKEKQLCEAKALEFEQKYVDAAEIYSEVYEYQDASRCYFIIGDWLKLIEANQKLLSVPKFQIRNFVAHIMLNESISLDTLFTYREAVANVFRDHELKFPILWEKEFYRMLAGRVRDQEVQAFAPAKKEELGQILVSFPANDSELLKVAAEMYFSTGNFQEAIRYWDRAEYVNHSDYQRGRFYITSDISRKLFYLSQYADSTEVLEFYREKEVGLSLEDFSAEIVQKAMLEGNAIQEAFAINTRYELPWGPMLKKQVTGINPGTILFLEALNEYLKGLPVGKRHRYLQMDTLNYILDVLKKESAVKKIIQEKHGGNLKKIRSKFQENSRLQQVISSLGYLVGLSSHSSDTFSGDYFSLFSALAQYWIEKPSDTTSTGFQIIACALERSHSVFKDIITIYFHLLKSQHLQGEARQFILERQRKVLFKICRRDIPIEERQMEESKKKYIADEVDRRLREVLGQNLNYLSYEDLLKIQDLPESPSDPSSVISILEPKNIITTKANQPDSEAITVSPIIETLHNPLNLKPDSHPSTTGVIPQSPNNSTHKDNIGEEKIPTLTEDKYYREIEQQLRFAQMKIEYLEKELKLKDEMINLLKKYSPG